MHAGMRDLNRLLGPGILRLGEMLTHGKISDEHSIQGFNIVIEQIYSVLAHAEVPDALTIKLLQICR